MNFQRNNPASTTGLRGGDKVLNNLKAEMARFGVSVGDISRAIKKSDRAVRDKINEEYDFTFPESKTIRDTYFPELSLEYLFASSTEEG